MHCVSWWQTINCSKCCLCNMECFPVGRNCCLHYFDKSFQGYMRIWPSNEGEQHENETFFFFFSFIYQMVLLGIALVCWVSFNCQIFHLSVFHVSGFIFYEHITKLHFLLNCLIIYLCMNKGGMPSSQGFLGSHLWNHLPCAFLPWLL